MRRSRMLAGAVAVVLTTSLGVVGSGGSPAGAVTYPLGNAHRIKIDPNTGGPADPYPSTVQAYGLGTRVTDVDVTLNGLSHTHPDDLDIELVSPGGIAVPLMSDTCGDQDLADLVLTFDDAAALSLPDIGGDCATGSFKPTDMAGNVDAWQVPPTATTLSAFNGTNPNGPWRLYVRDDDGTADTGGEITDGWSLTINTKAAPAVTIPGPASNDGQGPANPYPYTFPIGGPSRTATDVDVVLPGLTHPVPGSIEVLLVGPSGRAVVLMAGACGRIPFDDVNLVFDDSAETKLSANLGTCASGTHKPTIQDEVTPFPAPAPPGPYADKLSAFRGDHATGNWQLYVVDLHQDDAGYIADAPIIRVSTDTKPPNTKLTKRPKSSARTKAKLKFVSSETGSTFECRVDKRRWRSCLSPLKLKHLKVGKHRVKVRAIDESGNLDRSPVDVVWRVKRPR
jgi:subtilisin-like proprotein convertase family protein